MFQDSVKVLRAFSRQLIEERQGGTEKRSDILDMIIKSNPDTESRIDDVIVFLIGEHIISTISTRVFIKGG